MPLGAHAVQTRISSATPTTPPLTTSPTRADDPLSPLSPISPWPPLPPTSISDNRVRPEDTSFTTDLPSAKEIYGSLTVLLTYFAFALYLIWAFLPGSILEQWGWTWYPAQECAIIVPCYLMIIVLLAYFGYASLTAFLTPRIDSLDFITDESARIPPIVQGEERYYWDFVDKELPEAVDLPIDLVGRVLYPPRKRAHAVA